MRSENLIYNLLVSSFAIPYGKKDRVEEKPVYVPALILPIVTTL